MFGISGIWQHPVSTVPGVVAALLGLGVALGWLKQEMVPQIVGIAAPIIIGVIGMLYKGKADG